MVDKGKVIEISDDEDDVPTKTRLTTGIRVLVVDDDDIILQVARVMLTHCEYKVTTALGPREALDILNKTEGRFDIVLTDLYMEEMNGYELLKIVKKEFNITVVMMSADCRHCVQSKGLSLGASQFLSKPIIIEDLQNLWIVAYRDNLSYFSPLMDLLTGGRREDSQSSSSIHVDTPRIDGKRKRAKNNGKSPCDKKLPRSPLKKTRVVWVPELHNKFLDAIDVLGLKRAYPKSILELMIRKGGVEGLRRSHVASHLQKYRLFVKKFKQTLIRDDPHNLLGLHNQSPSPGNTTPQNSSSSYNYHPGYPSLTQQQRSALLPNQYPQQQQQRSALLPNQYPLQQRSALLSNRPRVVNNYNGANTFGSTPSLGSQFHYQQTPNNNFMAQASYGNGIPMGDLGNLQQSLLGNAATINGQNVSQTLNFGNNAALYGNNLNSGGSSSNTTQMTAETGAQVLQELFSNIPIERNFGNLSIRQGSVPSVRNMDIDNLGLSTTWNQSQDYDKVFNDYPRSRNVRGIMITEGGRNTTIQTRTNNGDMINNNADSTKNQMDVIGKGKAPAEYGAGFKKKDDSHPEKDCRHKFEPMNSNYYTNGESSSSAFVFDNPIKTMSLTSRALVNSNPFQTMSSTPASFVNSNQFQYLQSTPFSSGLVNANQLETLSSTPFSGALENGNQFQSMSSSPLSDAFVSDKYFQTMSSTPFSNGFVNGMSSTPFSGIFGNQFQAISLTPSSGAFVNENQNQTMTSTPSSGAFGNQFQPISSTSSSGAFVNGNQFQTMKSTPSSGAFLNENQFQAITSTPSSGAFGNQFQTMSSIPSLGAFVNGNQFQTMSPTPSSNGNQLQIMTSTPSSGAFGNQFQTISATPSSSAFVNATQFQTMTSTPYSSAFVNQFQPMSSTPSTSAIVNDNQFQTMPSTPYPSAFMNANQFQIISSTSSSNAFGNANFPSMSSPTIAQQQHNNINESWLDLLNDSSTDEMANIHSSQRDQQEHQQQGGEASDMDFSCWLTDEDNNQIGM